MEIRIDGDFEASDLPELQTMLGPEEEIELRPVRGKSSSRFVTGVEPIAVLAVLKGLASLTPLVVAVINYLGSKKAGGKVKTLKIIAQDDTALLVPENTSRESLGALLEQQPKFKNPKLITIE